MSTHLWRREYRECAHNTVWVFLADLGQQQCSHSGSGATAQGVGQLESLERVASLRLFADNVQH